MKKRLLIIGALLITAMLLLSGCAKSENYAFEPKGESYAPEGGLNYDDANYEKPSSQDGADKTGDIFAGRKVIRNASLTVETLEFDRFIAEITNKTNELGGYIQSNEIHARNFSYYSKSDLRSADTVVRIPADKLDEFLAAVDGAGNVTARSENVDDVTEAYTDIEARLASLRTEYDTLLDLLSKAENLDDIITLQDRLTNVRYEIESYEGKQRLYDNRIEYSTVHLSITEVERETAPVEEGFGQEISRRFRESAEDVWEGFKAFIIWFIGDLPKIALVLFFIAGLPLIIVLIIVKSVKRANRKRAEKRAKLAEKTAEQSK